MNVFLSDLAKKEDQAKSGQEGPQAHFAQFFKWLSVIKSDRNYDALRELVIDYMATNMAVGADQYLFGVQIVAQRINHSVYTAGRECGLNPQRIRRVLKAAGVISPASDNLPSNAVIFPVEISGPILEILKNAITLKEAARRINSKVKEIGLLVERGFIFPIFESDKLQLGKVRFDRRHIMAFAESLLAKATVVQAPQTGQFSLPTAAKRAKCAASDIVHLILSHRLTWVGQLSSESGYRSILVELSEVKYVLKRRDVHIP